MKVDVDQLSRLAHESGVIKIPTFQFYRDGKLAGQIMGANEYMVEQLIKSE